MLESLSEKVQLFKSVFKGREDVFAVRWEIKGKSGYMPAYYYDPYLYRAHKLQGGSFKNYNDKSHLKLTDNEIEKHLNGEQHIHDYSDQRKGFVLLKDSIEDKLFRLMFVKNSNTHTYSNHIKPYQNNTRLHFI